MSRPAGPSGRPWNAWSAAGILVLAYLAQGALGGHHDPVQLLALGVANPPLIEAGQLHRLVANAFWHSGPLQLALNTLVLALVGSRVEQRLGGAAFIVIAVTSAVAGAAAWTLLSPGFVALGASGATFGLCGAWILAPLPTKLERGLAVAATLVLLVGPALLLPNVAHASHLSGLITGGLCATLLPRFSRDLRATLCGLAILACGVSLSSALGNALLKPIPPLDDAVFLLHEPRTPDPVKLAIAGSILAREHASPRHLRETREALADLQARLDSDESPPWAEALTGIASGLETRLRETSPDSFPPTSKDPP